MLPTVLSIGTNFTLVRYAGTLSATPSTQSDRFNALLQVVQATRGASNSKQTKGGWAELSHQAQMGYLANERDITAVGLDTASIDYGQSTDFIVHRLLYEQNILGFENVANLDALPPVGA